MQCDCMTRVCGEAAANTHTPTSTSGKTLVLSSLVVVVVVVVFVKYVLCLLTGWILPQDGTPFFFVCLVGVGVRGFRHLD